jgi:hypothetical protein
MKTFCVLPPETCGFFKFIFKIAITLFLTAISFSGFAQQRIGFTDDFENGTLEMPVRGSQANRAPVKIWSTVTPTTYGLVESGGVLNIVYARIAGTGAFDHITYTATRAIDVTANPRIQVMLKSSVTTKVTVSPTYSLEPPTFEYLEKEVPGDNQWHTYNFDLTPKYYTGHNIAAVDFYFDRGIADAKSGKIEMDNFKIGWYLIKVNDLTAKVEDGKNISLSWKTSDQQTAKYNVYRSNQVSFEADDKTFLAETTDLVYTDKNLDPYKHYFYKVVPVSKSGEVFFASTAAGGETFIKGTMPLVKVMGLNSKKVGKYEKFELKLGLGNVGIENPYDPADIDVYAIFTTPSGKKIKINGFFDDYRGINQWKLRFSPNETGDYTYQVFVNDAGGKGESTPGKFTAIQSTHHGWIKPSVKNPHYFTYDDGTSYYGVGVYSPWGNNASRFETFAKNNANLFAIWDIGYGGFVNDKGLVEEELGRYNQPKLGEIDSLLTILEKDNIKLMFAIWPHDLFSETVWSAVWNKNPYRFITTSENVYADSLAWEYQKMKYRYLIARFAHSRSWGIWELINEMNGTDGWAKGHHQECFDWVEKCNRFFKENDPYNHPMTASFSGGFTEYREELYKRNDIPNIHMYPAQGWAMKYPEDKMRSDMYNFAWASKRFWDAFEKPAIFGEAGANLTYYQPREKEYHTSYHNQIWAALTNGLASTPVWWDFPVLNADDWSQLKNLSAYVSDIDFANLPYKPAELTSEGSDVFTLGTGSKAFGWIRTYSAEDISNAVLYAPGFEKGSYEIKWFDPWKGDIYKTEKAENLNGTLRLTVPKLQEARLDVAFKIEKR